MIESSVGGKFKPKHRSLGSFLPLPVTFNRIGQLHKKKVWQTIFVVLTLWWFFIGPISFFGRLFHSRSQSLLPPPHPLTSKNSIETKSRYIFPTVGHANLLEELGVNKLFKVTDIRDARAPDVEQVMVNSLNMYDDPDPAVQKLKEDEASESLELEAAKIAFKNQDKVVFRPGDSRSYPEVIVVTAIDFEKYSVDSLVKIVQNRVNYAHKHSYGVYVRWYQEFLPIFNDIKVMLNAEKAKWIRIFCVRAAMHAFPEAKWIWYLDEDSLIMNLNIDLQEYLLQPEALDPIMLREQPIIPPDGTIKTYKNTVPESTKLILTQSEHKLETSSFLVKNDNIGKSIIESWGNQLYLLYASFPYGPDSALTHILQWHPFVLSKTSIIPARTIAAKHTDVDLPFEANGKVGDHIHYYTGDLVATWSDCTTSSDCEVILNTYYDKLKPEDRK